MKKDNVIYPQLKRDSDGRITENKLTLLEPDEFIGEKFSSSIKPRKVTTTTRGRNVYLTL